MIREMPSVCIDLFIKNFFFFFWYKKACALMDMMAPNFFNFRKGVEESHVWEICATNCDVIQTKIKVKIRWTVILMTQHNPFPTCTCTAFGEF